MSEQSSMTAIRNAAQALVNAQTWAERKRIVEVKADLLLSDAADQLFAILLVQYKHNANLVRTLTECRALLIRCRDEELNAVFADHLLEEEIKKTSLAFVNAKSSDERQDIILGQPDLLLTDTADDFLATLLEKYKDNPKVIRELQDKRALLARCRQEGIKRAFTDRLRLQALQSELSKLTRRHEMPRRVEVCREALNLVEPEKQPALWASLQLKMGISLYQNRSGQRAQNIEQAIHHYRQALEVYTRQAYPEQWATIQNNLASAYRSRTRGQRAQNIEQAIKHFLLALKVRTRQAYPEQWAGTQNNLANAYRHRIEGQRTQNIEQAIKHFQQALEVYTRQAYPEQWAIVQNNLGLVYTVRIQGERAQNIEEAIGYYQQARRVYTRQAFPEQWAEVMNNLALAYTKRIQGEPAENIEQTIHYHQQSLDMYTRQAFPEQWAEVMNNLALAYTKRIQGERAENIEQTIHYHQQSLDMYTRQAFPQKWAEVMNQLGLAYRKRIRGKPAENIEEAIGYYEQAHQVYTRQAFPQKWAGVMNDLAIAVENRIRGERALNIEQALGYYQQASSVYTRQAFPAQWAMLNTNLANCFSIRIRGEPVDNLEKAIHHNQQALEVYTRTNFPEKWAITQNNLGNVYFNRIYGARVDNLEQAIHHYGLALEVRTRKAFRTQWAMTCNNIANAYRERIRGDRAENIEKALEYYKRALEVRTRQAAPNEWAQTMNNLANAYRERIRGDRAANLEQAIQHYQQALEVYTYQEYPEQWAMTQNNLATAYPHRIRGQSASNIQKAISHYKEALKVRTRQAFPEPWAGTSHNLANAYRKLTPFLAESQREKVLKQAIYHYQQALKVYTRQAYPQQWAMTQNNLANSYLTYSWFPAKGEDPLKQAIDHYQQALQVTTREAFPIAWAMIQHNLATVYSRYANRHSSSAPKSRTENIKQAIKHYQQALLVRTPQIFPENCRETAYRLGRLLYHEGNFTEARQALTIADQAIEALRGEVQRDAAKRELSQKNALIYAWLVSCCLQDANADEAAAFKYAAAGKGRAFVDMLASTRFDLEAAQANDAELKADLRQNREWDQQIDNLLTLLSGGQASLAQSGAPREMWREQLRLLQKQKAAHQEQMSFNFPNLTATQRVPALTKPEACALAAELGATLVEYYRHAKGWCAFVVTPDEVQHVPLDEVDDEFWQKMGKEWLERVSQPKYHNQESYDTLFEWYDVLIVPLSLPPTGKIVLAPASFLHFIPLSIARNEDTERYLCDEYQLTFTPSLTALHVSLLSAKKNNQTTTSGSLQTLLTAAYPGKAEWQTHPDKKIRDQYLDHAISEASALAAHFPIVTPLQDSEATPLAVIEHAKNKDVVHFSCHAAFDTELPEQSGFALYDGYLTVQRIITELRLTGTRLVTLSACRTHLADVKSGEEHTGLVQALMTAGAKCVVASLWQVPEKSTRALFEHFYRAVANGEPPATALQQAMQHVRQQTDKDGKKKWEHPFYWAAFQVSGLGYNLERRGF